MGVLEVSRKYLRVWCIFRYYADWAEGWSWMAGGLAKCLVRSIGYRGNLPRAGGRLTGPRWVAPAKIPAPIGFWEKSKSTESTLQLSRKSGGNGQQEGH